MEMINNYLNETLTLKLLLNINIIKMSCNLQNVSRSDLNDRLVIDIDNTQVYYINPLGQIFVVTDPAIYKKILNKFRNDGVKISSKAQTAEEKFALKLYQKVYHTNKKNLVY